MENAPITRTIIAIPIIEWFIRTLISPNVTNPLLSFGFTSSGLSTVSFVLLQIKYAEIEQALGSGQYLSFVISSLLVNTLVHAISRYCFGNTDSLSFALTTTFSTFAFFCATIPTAKTKVIL